MVVHFSNNDDLTHYLIKHKYIRSERVRHAFRAVDRGNYCLNKEDVSRSYGTDYGKGLSCPLLESQVMEALKLRKGMSFLHLECGTGYLNTLVGLLLGIYGTNHGIDIIEEAIHHAESKLKEFQNSSIAMDIFEFCSPSFGVGDSLPFNSGLQYDRVYSIACRPWNLRVDVVKKLLRIGGIWVVSVVESGKLCQLTRRDEYTLVYEMITHIDFFPILLTANHKVCLNLPEKIPPDLQTICRSRIRELLRNTIQMDRMAYFQDSLSDTIIGEWFRREGCDTSQGDLETSEANSSPATREDSSDSETHDFIEIKKTHQYYFWERCKDLMISKIQLLPLPLMLQKFLNFNKPL